MNFKPLPVVPSQEPAAADAGAKPKQTTAGLVRDPGQAARLEPKIVEAISTVYDPEIPVNIYELGLIYEIIVDADGRAGVRMTLTAPGCPAAQVLPAQVEEKVRAIPGVSDAIVEVVWDPPWDRDRMSDAAKLALGIL